MREGRLGGGVQFRKNSPGQDLSEFDTPLVEGVDLPDDALRENRMLVKRYESAQRGRGEPLREDRVRRPIALEHAMGRQPLRRAFVADLLQCFPEGQSLGL